MCGLSWVTSHTSSGFKTDRKLNYGADGETDLWASKSVFTKKMPPPPS